MQPRQYQIDAVDAVFNYLKRNPDNHPLVALPTGSGKSLVAKMLCERILSENKDANILVISHESQILLQNYAAILGVPASVGLYSSGLDRRDIQQITIAGIQSIFRIAEEFKQFNYVIIDECHTIPMNADSMYRKFLSDEGIGEHTRIGMSATPFKLGHGYIVGENHLFDKIVIDLTSHSKFTRLVKDGFICNLVTNETQNPLDTQDMKVNNDFAIKEMSDKFNRESITKAAVAEMILKAYDRKKWLIFAIDIDHADNICDMLIERGISAMSIHSKMEFDKQGILEQYKSGSIKAIVNVEMLTTGFDSPDIDMIGLLRPTNSPNLHVQMIGRGLRVSPGKKNCLVLDYAGNTKRLGPINKIEPTVKKKGKSTGEPITKTCPDCGTITYPVSKLCEQCGYKFEFKESLLLTADDSDVILQKAKWYDVTGVTYNRHTKRNSPDSIVVAYHCGLKLFKEWILPDHKGYAQFKAMKTLEAKSIIYKDIEDTINKLRESDKPKRIKVDTSGKYSAILGYD